MFPDPWENTQASTSSPSLAKIVAPEMDQSIDKNKLYPGGHGINPERAESQRAYVATEQQCTGIRQEYEDQTDKFRGPPSFVITAIHSLKVLKRNDFFRRAQAFLLPKINPPNLN